VFPPSTVSPVEGLRAALGTGVQVDHGLGVRSTDRLPVAPLALFRCPDGGGAGVEVRFLAAAYDRARTRPELPFGHGLGYTTWEYLDVTVPPHVDPDGDAVASVRVRNTGTRPGREVVQVYASRPDSAVERPIRWLAGFATVTAGPGQEVTAEMTVPACGLAHWDGESHAWTIEHGSFHLAVGRSYGDQRLATEIAVATTSDPRPKWLQ
jgi:Fibronectin type III-like domain